MKTPNLIYVRHNQNALAPEIGSSPIFFDELTLVLKGELLYSVNGEETPLSDGDAIWIRSGSIRARKPSAEPADYISFNFQADEPLELPTLLRDSLSNDIRLLLASCDEILQKYYPNHEEQITHLLCCLLLTLQNHWKRKSLHPLVRKITRYLHEHMSERITLSHIGEYTFFSPVYCDAIFKKEMGTSIIDYLLDERIHSAKQLLAEGSLSFRQIAETVGFFDYNYFSRTFKKRTGYTPGQYRRMVLNAMEKE